jgi:hypothetical protein
MRPKMGRPPLGLHTAQNNVRPATTDFAINKYERGLQSVINVIINDCAVHSLFETPTVLQLVKKLQIFFKLESS